jgi:hypothetical protein
MRNGPCTKALRKMPPHPTASRSFVLSAISQAEVEATVARIAADLAGVPLAPGGPLATTGGAVGKDEQEGPREEGHATPEASAPCVAGQPASVADWLLACWGGCCRRGQRVAAEASGDGGRNAGMLGTELECG